MTSTRLEEIDALRAPEADEGILVWPEAVTLADLARRNHQQLSRQTVVLCERGFERRLAAVPTGVPIIMTGHQPEFFHAGVWVKNVAAVQLAQQTGGRAIFLIVDSDVPGRLAIEWPDDSEALCKVGSAVVRSYQDWRSYEHISPRAVDELVLALQAAPNRIDPETPTLIDVFRNDFAGATDESDYVARWQKAVQAVEEAIGTPSPEFVRVSEWFNWDAPATEQPLVATSAAFFAHIALNAARFTNSYNNALAAYRQRRAIRGTQHPIPDLAIEAARYELPFWHVSPEGPRQRVWVSNTRGDAITFFSDTQPLGTVAISKLRHDPQSALGSAGPRVQIRPRALAQTLFARLFVCDLFIHGIGGAKYDTITDDIIRDFFEIEPTAYACVSATLELPTRRFGVTKQMVTDARRSARDLRFNPQRFMRAETLSPEQSRLLADRRDAIAESDRLRASHSMDRIARRRAYQKIMVSNERLTRLLGSAGPDPTQQVHQLQEQYASDRIAGSREWFFALHEPRRLIKLANAIKLALTPDQP